jgi:pyrimidine-specific ribonucleoside hydrolase
LKNFNLCSKNARLLFNPGNGKLNVFDYNYELDTKSMDVLNSPIPLVFAGYEPSSYTHIGNIDLASLDRKRLTSGCLMLFNGWKKREVFWR